ncbi:MAG: FG-GAP-like repeat-containing protein [Candidatus Edwardsbacteria bacterium]
MKKIFLNNYHESTKFGKQGVKKILFRYFVSSWFMLFILLPTHLKAWQEFSRLKPAEKTILEQIKKQPRKYQDSICKRRILEQKRIQRQKRAPHLLKAGVPDTINILAIRVEFQPDDDSLTWGNGLMNLKGNGDTIPMCIDNDCLKGHNIDYEPPHTKIYFERQLIALRNYWWKVSSGKLYLNFRVLPDADRSCYRLPHQMSYYSDFYNQWENFGWGIYELMKDAVEAADADPVNIQFSDYDAYIIFHAGSAWQSWPWGADLPTLAMTFEDYPIYVNNGSEKIVDGAIQPETASSHGITFGLQGSLAHEFGHQIGLPDLYDISYWSVGSTGEWCLMGLGNFGLNGFVPSHPSAWCKYYLGWIEPKVVNPGAGGLNVAIRWIESDDTAGIRMVKVPINSHEYFLIENRRAYTNPDTAIHPEHPDSNGARVWYDGVLVKFDDYDYSLPLSSNLVEDPHFKNQGGLLIWHIDEQLIAERWSTNSLAVGKIKAIDLEEADGIQDLERWGGSPYETYASGYDCFYDPNNTAFTSSSTPNSRSNNGADTHIIIENISAPDTVMTCRIRDWRRIGFPVSIGSPADWNSPVVADLDRDGTKNEIIINSSDGIIYVWHDDGTPYLTDTTGLFAKVPSRIYSSCAIGDLVPDDSDSLLDIVVSVYDSALYAWHGNGDSISNFPVKTKGPIISSPALADLDGDGNLEILVGSDDRNLYAWHSDGTTVSGFPVFLAGAVQASPAIADINNDGKPEIVIISGDNRLFVLKSDGTMLEGWPQITPRPGYVNSSPVVGDVDRDGQKEIITVACGKVYCFKPDGTSEPGWPVDIEKDPYAYPYESSSPALGDIDNDGYLEISVAAGHKLYCFNYNGTLVTGFPVTLVQAPDNPSVDTLYLVSSPVIGDIDKDKKLEIVIGSPDGKLYAFNGDGGLVDGYPLSCGGAIYSTPVLFDLTPPGGICGSPSLGIAVGCDDKLLYVWDPCLVYLKPDFPWNIPWGMFRQNEFHNGEYPASLMPLPVAVEGPILSGVYNYPNPAYGQTTKIRYHLNSAAEVSVKIFNIAGELIKNFQGTGFERTENELKWDLSGIASGVYICRVEAKAAGKKEVKFCKIAVVR